jgi:hypothetical protein
VLTIVVRNLEQSKYFVRGNLAALLMQQQEEESSMRVKARCACAASFNILFLMS